MSKFLDLEGLQSVVSKMKSLINERAQDYEITSEYPFFTIYANNKNGIYRLTGDYDGDASLFYKGIQGPVMSGPGWKNGIFYITKDNEDPDNYSYFFGWGRETSQDDEAYGALILYWGIASQNDPDDKAYCFSRSLESTSNKVTSLLSTAKNYEYPSAKAVYDQLVLKEVAANKTTSLSSSSTDVQYPSAKAVYDEINNKISSVYKAKGTCTFANKPALIADNEGFVYNISDAFTTTADFIEGAGKSYPAGTNIIVINNGTTENPDWKYDVLAGMTDLSGYVQKTGDTMTGPLTTTKLTVGTRESESAEGTNSTSLGTGNLVSGSRAFSSGAYCSATGDYSIALGHGYNAETMGIKASGYGALAGGRVYYNTNGSAGKEILSSGFGCFAYGAACRGGAIYARSVGSFATGYANGIDSRVDADGDANFALGCAWGDGAVINAAGPGSLAVGKATASHKIQAAHDGAIAMGYAGIGDIIASGLGSFATGDATSASGNYSQAFGIGTTANSLAQRVEGQYNIIDTEGTASTKGTYAHIIGNGTSTSARSNAYTLDWNGNGWFKGGLTVNSGDVLLSSGNLKVVAGLIHGENNGTASYTNHTIKLGHAQEDYCDFYEYGGVFHFYKSVNGTNTLLGTINTNGWEGKAALLSGSTAITQAAGTNNTTIATTAFVTTATGALAPKASPALTGTPTAPTAAVSVSSTQIATTAYVTNKLADKITGQTTDPGVGSSLATGKIILVYEA